MLETIFFGFLGGFAVNLLNLLELKNVKPADRPNFKEFIYWLPFILYPLLGALLVYVYVASETPLKPLVAFQIGISAPLILKSLAGAIPNQIVPNADESA